MSTIFVQIASYRDLQLLPTLRDLISKATNPSRLRFGICWQREETESLEEFARDLRFRIIDINYRDARGACWARHQTQSLYEGEDYTLQIDLHHRFVLGWDDELLAMLELAGSRKPILTSYAPSFDPSDTSGVFSQQPWALKFHRFTEEGVIFFLPDPINDWETLTAPLPARFFSAHFAFAHGAFCREVPYDPNYYFHGEEISMGVRAFTHGYDLFHPHRVIFGTSTPATTAPNTGTTTPWKRARRRHGRPATSKPSAATASCSGCRTATLISGPTVSAAFAP